MSNRQPIPTFKKQMVYSNCNGKCKICGKQLSFKRSTIDHIVPLYHGGTDDLKNLQIACKSCNKLKLNMMPQEFCVMLARMFVGSLSGTFRHWINQLSGQKGGEVA